jgi:hypothetical protein
MGMPGVDVSSNTKPVMPDKAKEKPPQGAPQQQQAPPEQGQEEVPPEMEEPEPPESVEKLPKPEKLKKDERGNPDKERLLGHTVKFDGRDYTLDWDEENMVYMLVDPDTLIVKTRVKPEHVSTIDFEESINVAIRRVYNGLPVEHLVEFLLDD